MTVHMQDESNRYRPAFDATGKPFEYRNDGAKATLMSRIPGEPLDKTGLRYTLTIRK